MGTWARGTDSSAMARLEKKIADISGLPASHSEVCLANVLALVVHHDYDSYTGK